MVTRWCFQVDFWKINHDSTKASALFAHPRQCARHSYLHLVRHPRIHRTGSAPEQGVNVSTTFRHLEMMKTMRKHHEFTILEICVSFFLVAIYIMIINSWG